jgi:L-ascorbate metabolism protein UlaG (beta-lactamase superfamily)
MAARSVRMIGGPLALLELEGIRLLTDPTFDPPGDDKLPHVTLRKTAAPALSDGSVGRVDAVLLSHDRHADNLDTAGRAYLAGAGRVFTTMAGATFAL